MKKDNSVHPCREEETIMPTPMPLPKFSAKLAFVLEDGTEIEERQLKATAPIDLLELWRVGHFRRTVKVTTHPDESKTHFREYICNAIDRPDSKELGLLGDWFLQQLCRFAEKLSLASLLLKKSEVPKGGHASFKIYKELEEVKPYGAMVDGSKITISELKFPEPEQQRLFPSCHDLDSYTTFEIGKHDDDLDPEEFIENLLLRVLKETIGEDNAAIFQLLQTASTAFNHSLLVTEFTEVSFATTRNFIWADAALPVPTAVAPLDLLLTMSPDFRQSWFHPEKLVHLLEGRLGKLGDIDVLCTGSKWDPLNICPAEALYMCSPPENLGRRFVTLPYNISVVDLRPHGKAKSGLFFYTRHATAIENSRAVAECQYKEATP